MKIKRFDALEDLWNFIDLLQQANGPTKFAYICIYGPLLSAHDTVEYYLCLNVDKEYIRNLPDDKFAQLISSLGSHKFNELLSKTGNDYKIEPPGPYGITWAFRGPMKNEMLLVVVRDGLWNDNEEF